MAQPGWEESETKSPRQNRFNRDQDAAFVYRNGTHVEAHTAGARQHGGGLRGPSAAGHSHACNGHGTLLPQDVAENEQSAAVPEYARAANGLGSGNAWAAHDTGVSHSAQRHTWQVNARTAPVLPGPAP